MAKQRTKNDDIYYIWTTGSTSATLPVQTPWFLTTTLSLWPFHYQKKWIYI